MNDTPAPAMLGAMGAALLLLLAGVSYAGVRSLDMRGQGERIRGWLIELWLFALLFAALFWLSARAMGFDLLEALGDVREGTMSTSSLVLAIVGGVVGLVCAFRMFGLVREGVGQLYDWDDDTDASSGGDGEVDSEAVPPDEERDEP
jgi:hypothetical protein